MSDTPPPMTRNPDASIHDWDETPVARALRVAQEGRQLARETRVEVVEHGDRLDALERLVGRAPSALPGDRGSGLAQHLVDLTTELARLRESVDADRKQRAEEIGRLAKAREPWSKVSWVAIGAVIVTLVGTSVAGAYHWLSTLHH